MVSQIIIIGVIAFAFFALGGLKKVEGVTKGLLGSDLVGNFQKSQSGEVVVDNLQSSASIPTKQGSQNTINTILSSQIIRTDITEKRKFNAQAQKPEIKTTFADPKSGGSEGQFGFTVTTNSSAGKGFGLVQGEVDKIRKQPFTAQEKKDIIALQNRLNSKDPAIAKLKDSPQEVIFKKREQEAIAKKTLGERNFVFSGGVTTRGGSFIEKKGGLFGKSNFALGGKTPAEFEQQQKDKATQRAKLEQNRKLQEQRETTGRTILSTIAKSGLNQKQFARERGINLSGKLSAVALAKLREKGFRF